MTYSPGTPGFQPSQPPGSYGPSTPSTPSFAKTADAESKLPLYLQIAVAVLGLGVYLANFGPIVTVTNGEYPLILGDAGHTVPLALLAGLLAAVGVLPKAKQYTAVVAAIATLGALLAISTLADAGGDYTVGWGLWLVLTFSVLQAAAAIGELLLDAGVITAPAPRPKYDPYAQYGLPPGGNYYGQPGQHGYGQQGPQQQSGGYPSYGGYPSSPSSGGFGAQSAPSTGGFSSGSQPAQSAQSAQQGPPTPPTGFPSFGSPSSGGSGSSSTAGQGGTGQGQSSSSTGAQQAQGGSAPSGPAQP